MIYVRVSINDTALGSAKKPGVSYREHSTERGMDRIIYDESEIFAVKVTDDHLNEAIDKAIRTLEGMKNPDRIVLGQEHREESMKAEEEYHPRGVRDPLQDLPKPRPIKDIPQA